MKKIILSSLVFVLIVLSTNVFAQTLDSSLYDQEGFLLENTIDNSEPGIDSANLTQEELKTLFVQQEINPDNAKMGELASCFDYYEFGSVDINLIQDYDEYESGDPVYIQGKIKNNNSYPVIGMDIKARLVKDIPEPKYLRSEIITLEDFDLAENLTLDAGEEYAIEYSHLLPLNAPSGTYQMYFYAVEQDRYNLDGLSFTNDIIGSKISFEVTGTNPDHVYLDQTQITVGEQAHNVMAFMTSHTPNTSVPISIPLYNPGTQSTEMTVTYNLYSWDSANPKNLITTKTEQVTVEPKSEKLFTYTLENGVLPVYYLSITAQPNNPAQDESVFKEKTVSNIRFIIEDTSLSRLNFSAVNTYPLKKGIEATLVTCFHNTNENEDPYSKIETQLKDTRGNILAQTVYEGSVPSAINGIIQKFDPKKDISNFVISTILYDKDNKVVDQVDKVYACEDINPDACPSPFSSYSLIMGIVIIGIIGLGIFMIKKNPLTIEKI